MHLKRGWERKMLFTSPQSLALVQNGNRARALLSIVGFGNYNLFSFFILPEKEECQKKNV